VSEQRADHKSIRADTARNLEYGRIESGSAMRLRPGIDRDPAHRPAGNASDAPHAVDSFGSRRGDRDRADQVSVIPGPGPCTVRPRRTGDDVDLPAELVEYAQVLRIAKIVPAAGRMGKVREDVEDLAAAATIAG
jgi:hypothetical protein